LRRAPSILCGGNDAPPPAPKRGALAKHFDRDRRQIYRWIDSYGLRRDGGGGS
jgi:hypothetical protein